MLLPTWWNDEHAKGCEDSSKSWVWAIGEDRIRGKMCCSNKDFEARDRNRRSQHDESKNKILCNPDRESELKCHSASMQHDECENDKLSLPVRVGPEMSSMSLNSGDIIFFFECTSNLMMISS